MSSESFTVNLRQAATNGARRPAGTLQQSGLVAALLQQIHDDLRIQHPEWVQPNGESPMCDFYEERLMDLLGSLTRNGPKGTSVPPLALGNTN